MINSDACTVLDFSDLTCHLENTGKTWKQQSRVSQSTGKTTRVVLVS